MAACLKNTPGDGYIEYGDDKGISEYKRLNDAVGAINRGLKAAWVRYVCSLPGRMLRGHA